MAEGKLVAFEGIDGSGLTTQAHKLASWFRGQGQRCRLTKEPSEGPVGALIRLVVQKRLRELAEENDLDHWLALLFAADRQDHLTNVILPTIRNGIHVITDRYYLSSFAYQGLKVDFGHLGAMNGRCRRPDLTVFLDVPVDVCKDRIDQERSQNRWGTDLYEEPDKLAEVRRKFFEAMDHLKAHGDRIEIVNGNDAPDRVHESVLAAVQKMLAENDAPKSRLLLPDAAGIATAL
jgi:dTMP kinase